MSGVRLESGELLTADAVVTAVDPAVARLDLLNPPLQGAEADRLRGRSRGNAVQMLVHLGTTSLPRYRNAQPGDWNGLQS